ncbi:hypothetical protein Q8A73_009688 [Channa argus]|nr:hypothetical protein Q8A73_009688 [Channa argus]
MECPLRKRQFEVQSTAHASISAFTALRKKLFFSLSVCALMNLSLPGRVSDRSMGERGAPMIFRALLVICCRSFLSSEVQLENHTAHYGLNPNQPDIPSACLRGSGVALAASQYNVSLSKRCLYVHPRIIPAPHHPRLGLLRLPLPSLFLHTSQPAQILLSKSLPPLDEPSGMQVICPRRRLNLDPGVM